MKLYVTIFVLLCFYHNLSAQNTVVSATNRGVYVAISGTKTGEPIRFDSKLVWRPFCTGDPVELNYLAPSFGIKISMRGPDDREATKTTLGQTFGASFDKVHRFEDTMRGWHTGSITADGSYDFRSGVLSGPVIPPPAALFNMGHPGTYTLVIQMQMFRIVKSTNQWSRELIRFSPIKVKVVKPAEE
jgi:hypothetical protein